MRRAPMLSVAVLGLMALAACSKKTETAAATGDAAPTAAAAPAALTSPKRKPGLWSHSISSAGTTQTMKVCLDADTDAKMTVWGQAVGDNTCEKSTFKPAPGGWSFESVCAMGQAGTITSKGSITGDFNSAYTMKISSNTVGAAYAQANGAHETNMSAKWDGACPADMKGGDVQIAMPGMDKPMTINLEQMAAAKK